MCVITQWIQKRREQRQLLEERKKREAERQMQREKQDYEYGRSLQLILHSLQRTMDPLIASQAYNNRFCPLTRLPEELLIKVLNFLRGDDVTLCCLRVTSRTFLRLLHDKSAFWTKPILVSPYWSLEYGLRLQFLRLLKRDGRCENCKRWNDANVRYSHDPCKFRGSWLRGYPRSFGCEYRHYEYGRPHCSACDTDHDICQFPLAYQRPPQTHYLGSRVCLGQQGLVQLCEHVHISWAGIKTHIDDWRRQRLLQHGEGGEEPRGAATAEDNWQACLDSFSIECHDPTHDVRCTATGAPTWPRARLGTGSSLSRKVADIVVLYLEWTPHGRLDALVPSPDGRIRASELRAMFQRFRRLGPADILYPRGRPEALPEMACFTHSFPIYYKMEEGDGREEGGQNIPPPPSPSPLPPPTSRYYQSLSGRDNSRRLNIRPHYPNGASDTSLTSQCLIVNYQRGINVCKTTALTDPAVKLVPSDQWLHAMDPLSYPHQQARQFRPQCRDESCTNYYRRTKDYVCSN